MARASKQRPRGRTSVSVTVEAPNKGLNTVDPLASMNEAYSLTCQNFIATPQGLALRQGYRKWATGLPGITTSLFQYHTGAASSSRQFAVVGGAFYDITYAGAVGAAVVTGQSTTATYWQSTSQTFSTGNKNYLVCVNGVNMPWIYEGTAWTQCTQVAVPAAPGQWKTTDNNGNAVNMAAFVDTVLHQQRLWFVLDNSTKCYYSDIAQVGGNLNLFDFGSYFPRGGKLLKLAPWTMDIGGQYGTQAMMVAISDRGDVVIFLGTNPAAAATWAVQAYYQIGAPVGRRCTTQYQGDLMILSQDGLYPLSKYLQSGRLDSTAALTYTIAPTISSLVQTMATTPGFELITYPGQNVLMLNVPQSQQTNNFQFCYHTITQGWTQFTGWASQCWGLFNDALYFGGNGFVALSFIGYQDGADINGYNGSNIVGNVLSAYTNFTGRDHLGPGVIKSVRLIKPYFVTGMAAPTIRIGVNVDYALVSVVGGAAQTAPAGGVWDSSLWDGPNSTWAGSLATYNQWQTPVCFPGDAIAISMSVSATTDILWTSTGLLIEPGRNIA